MPADSASRRSIPVRRATRQLGEHLQAWRRLSGLTQSQLADRAGLDRKTVMRVERGDASIAVDSLLSVLHVLGVLEGVVRASDPYETDVGRMRADEVLPRRVRPRNLGRDDG